MLRVVGKKEPTSRLAELLSAHALGAQRHCHHPMAESEGCLGVAVVADGIIRVPRLFELPG